MQKYRPTTQQVFIFTVVVFGFAMGAQAIHDNSTLTHLRTGLDMARTHIIPRHDPYSYSAPGVAWHLQSWFIEYVYGVLLRINSTGFSLVLLNGAISAAVFYVVCKLGATRRLDTMAIAVGVPVAMLLWSIAPRPLLVGWLGFALLLWIVIHEKRAWLLAPVTIIWVWSHGSWVLGGVWLFVYSMGVLAENAPLKPLLKYWLWFLGSILVASIWPLGLSAILFPLTAGSSLAKQGLVLEWQSPSFRGGSAVVALLGLGATVFVFGRRQVSWRLLLPSAFFFMAALFSVRNMAILGLVLAPALASAFNDFPERDPAEADDEPATVSPIFAGIASVLLVLLLVVVPLMDTKKEPLNLSRVYPVKAIDYLESNGYRTKDARWLTQDWVGNYLVCRYGVNARIFMDDRFDMFPPKVVDEYRDLLRGNKSTAKIIKDTTGNVVVWEKDSSLANWFDRREGWHKVYSDKRYVAYVRNDVKPDATRPIKRTDLCSSPRAGTVVKASTSHSD